ncbi:MAG: Cholesterol 25-hydroxylase-like protein [Chrysothrix sp. TS-e1954]|nr:MAG: Cholesterol 25-hydroxylase-like protein [Chrysothrix sp. TS-e1954]
MTSNATIHSTGPPAPSCTLVPQASLIPRISDSTLAVLLPTLVYAVAGGFFHLLDTYELFSNHRIHPSGDELKRNHITKWQCLQGVVRYHVMQISIGLFLDYGSSPTMVGDDNCRILRAANAISQSRNLVPMALTSMGIDAKGFGFATQGISARLAQVVGGDYMSSENVQQRPTFSAMEVSLAKFVVFIGIPAIQYLVALAVVDTWIYFTHRLCHVNKTLYRLVHAQHHRIYVSYAYGAVYAHWLETLFLDILSFVLAGEVARFSARQSMVFGSFATIKTLSDHCGYVFPWDPFRLVNNNGAVFHDLHHQSWGLKHNFSTYTVFWDNILGTTWADKAGADARYKRVHDLTAKKSDKTSTPDLSRRLNEAGGQVNIKKG